MGEMRNGLICYVYKTPELNGCALGGISERHNCVLLVGDGVDGPFDEQNARATGMPVVVLVRREHLATGGGPYFHAIPDGATGTMMGGAFIYSIDARFPFDYPLPLHDRIDRSEKP
jgi:hypothetical protein